MRVFTKNAKRFISLLLAVLLMVPAMSLSAFAAEGETTTVTLGQLIAANYADKLSEAEKVILKSGALIGERTFTYEAPEKYEEGLISVENNTDDDKVTVTVAAEKYTDDGNVWTPVSFNIVVNEETVEGYDGLVLTDSDADGVYTGSCEYDGLAFSVDVTYELYVDATEDEVRTLLNAAGLLAEDVDYMQMLDEDVAITKGGKPFTAVDILGYMTNKDLMDGTSAVDLIYDLATEGYSYDVPDGKGGTRTVAIAMDWAYEEYVLNLYEQQENGGLDLAKYFDTDKSYLEMLLTSADELETALDSNYTDILMVTEGLAGVKTSLNGWLTSKTRGIPYYRDLFNEVIDGTSTDIVAAKTEINNSVAEINTALAGYADLIPAGLPTQLTPVDEDATLAELIVQVDNLYDEVDNLHAGLGEAEEDAQTELAAKLASANAQLSAISTAAVNAGYSVTFTEIKKAADITTVRSELETLKTQVEYKIAEAENGIKTAQDGVDTVLSGVDTALNGAEGVNVLLSTIYNKLLPYEDALKAQGLTLPDQSVATGITNEDTMPEKAAKLDVAATALADNALRIEAIQTYLNNLSTVQLQLMGLTAEDITTLGNAVTALDTASDKLGEAADALETADEAIQTANTGIQTANGILTNLATADKLLAEAATDLGVAENTLATLGTAIDSLADVKTALTEAQKALDEAQTTANEGLTALDEAEDVLGEKKDQLELLIELLEAFTTTIEPVVEHFDNDEWNVYDVLEAKQSSEVYTAITEAAAEVAVNKSYDAADLSGLTSLYVDSAVVRFNMAMYTVEHKVLIYTVDENNEIPNEATYTQRWAGTYEEGCSVSAIIVMLDENVDGYKENYLGDAAGHYVIDSKAYAVDEEECTEEQLPTELNADLRYTITIYPVEYAVTADGIDDITAGQYYYGSKITLRKHTDKTLRWDYTVNGQPYSQGATITITGNTVITRTEGQAYDQYSLYETVAGNLYTDSDSEYKLLFSDALTGDTTLNVCTADFNALLSVSNADGIATLTAQTAESDYEGLLWTPYSYAYAVTTDGTAEVKSGYFTENAGTYSVELGDAYGDVTVEYRLTLSNIDLYHECDADCSACDTAVLTLLNTLVAEAEGQIDALDKLTSTTITDNLTYMSTTVLGVAQGQVSKTTLYADDEEKNAAMQALYTEAFDGLLTDCFNDSGTSKLADLIADHDSNNNLYSYYSAPNAYLEVVEDLSTYLTKLLGEGSYEYNGTIYHFTVEEKQTAMSNLLDVAGKGLLSETQLESAKNSLNTLESTMAGIKDELVAPNERIGTSSEDLVYFASYLEQLAASYSPVANAGDPYLPGTAEQEGNGMVHMTVTVSYDSWQRDGAGNILEEAEDKDLTVTTTVSGTVTVADGKLDETGVAAVKGKVNELIVEALGEEWETTYKFVHSFYDDIAAQCDALVDTTPDGTFTVSLKEKTQCEQGKHTAADEWSWGEAGHWHECTKCGEDLDFAKHEYPTEGDCNRTKTCTICTYQGSGHDLEEKLTHDYTGHWYKCNNCDTKVGFVSHTDEANVTVKTSTKDATCIVDGTKTTVTTCKDTTGCGWSKTETETITAQGHKYGEWQHDDNNAVQHYRVCTNTYCDKDATATEWENHTIVVNTVTDVSRYWTVVTVTSSCETCGYNNVATTKTFNEENAEIDLLAGLQVPADVEPVNGELTLNGPVADGYTDDLYRYDYVVYVNGEKYTTASVSGAGSTKLINLSGEVEVYRTLVNVRNEEVQKLIAAMGDGVVVEGEYSITPNSYTSLTVNDQDGLMNLVMALVMNNTYYGSASLNGEQITGGDSISLMAVLYGVMGTDGKLTDEELIEMINSGVLVENGALVLGEEITYELGLTINLDLTALGLGSVAGMLESTQPYADIVIAKGDETNDLYLNVELDIRDKGYQAFIAALLLEGVIEKDEINDVTPATAYTYFKEYMTVLLGDTVTLETFTNTLASFGYALDLSGYESYFNMVKSLELTYDAEGIHTTKSVSGEKVKETLSGALGEALGDMADTVLDMIDECEDGIAIGVNVTVKQFHEEHAYQAIVIDRDALDATGLGKLNVVDCTEDLAAKLNGITGQTVVMLQQDVAGGLTFKGDAILDLNGKTVNGNITANGTLIIVDSTVGTTDCGTVTGTVTGDSVTILAGTYTNDVTDYLKAGYVWGETTGVVSNEFYTMTEDAEGNVSFVLDADIIAMGKEDMPSAKALAMDMALDLVLNNFTAASLALDNNTIYSVEFDDLMETLSGEDTVNALLAVVKMDGIEGFVNQVLDDSLEFADMSAAIENGEAIFEYDMTTAPWDVTLSHNADADCITVGVQPGTEKSITVSVTVGGEEANKQELIDLTAALGNIVEDATDINVGLMDQLTYEGGSLPVEVSGDINVALDLTGDANYAVVLGVVLAYGNSDLEDTMVQGINAYYSYNKNPDLIEEAFDEVTVYQVFTALKSLSPSVDFAAMMSELGVVVEDSTDVEALEGAYHELLVASGALLGWLDIDGGKQAMSGAKESEGVYSISWTNVNRAGTVSIVDYDLTVTSATLTVKLFGDHDELYTVTYDNNGGTGTMEPDWPAYAYGAKISLPECGFTAPTGMTFVEWDVNGDPCAEDFIMITEDTVIKAVWGYTVSFDPNDGEGTMDPVAVEAGEYTLPECGFTAPAGQQFKAWNVDSTEYAAGDTITVTGNVTVTAVWKDIPVTTYTVTYDADGGSGTPAAASYSAGDTITLPEYTFTKPTSATFMEWDVNGVRYDAGDEITITGDTLIKAIWGYRISLSDPEQNQSLDVNSLYEKGSQIASLGCPFTAPEGKVFDIWSVDGEVVEFPYTITGPVTFQVNWKEGQDWTINPHFEDAEGNTIDRWTYGEYESADLGEKLIIAYDVNYSYDPDAVTVTYSGTQCDGTDVYGEAMPDVAGTYTVTVTIPATGEYDELVGNFTYMIKQLTFDVKWDYSEPFRYDGMSHGVTVTEETVEGLPEGARIEYNDWAVGTDAGSYIATATIVDEIEGSGVVDTNNYQTQYYLDWEIEASEVKADGSVGTPFSEDIFGDSAEYYFTGLTELVVDELTTILLEQGDIQEDAVERLTFTFASVDGSDYGATDNMEMLKVAILARADEKGGVYVGDYEITLMSSISSEQQMMRMRSSAGDPNYTHALSTFTLTIDPLAINDGNLAAFTYDGTEKTVTIDTVYAVVDNQTVEVPATIAGYGTANYTVSGELEGTNADTYRVTITGQGNYTGEVTKEWTIAEAELENVSVAQNGTLIYNGETQYADVNASADTVDGSSVTFTYRPDVEGTTFGENVPGSVFGPLTVCYEAKAPNHKTATGTFVITIAPKPVTATVTVEDQVYNGDTAAETVTATVDNADIVGSSDVITITGLTGTFADAVVGRNKVVTIDATNAVVTGTNSNCYDITYPATVTANITHKRLTAWIDVHDKVYDGTTEAEYDVYFTLEGAGPDGDRNCILSGDELKIAGGLTVSFDSADANTNVRVFRTLASEGLHREGNNSECYDICGTILVADYATIEPAELIDVSVAQSGTLTYNGSAQAATVTTGATAVNNQTVTFTYSTAVDGTYGAAVPAFTTAGSHEVFYKATAANHNEATGSFFVTIALNADVEVPTGLTATYGDTLADVVLPDGFTWEVDSNTYVGNAGSNTFTVTYTPADTTNYSVVTGIPVVIDVAKADQTAPAAPVLSSKTENRITVNAVAGCEYSLDGNTWQSANEFTGLNAKTEYTIYARKAATENYNASPASAGLKVTTDEAYSGGGYSGGGYYESTITVPVSGEENTVHATATVSGTTVTVKPLDEQELHDLLGAHVETGVVVIDLTDLDKDINKVNLPVETLKAIVKAAEEVGNDTDSLRILMPAGSVEFDDAALRGIINQVECDTVRVVVDVVGKTRLNSAQKNAIADMEVYEGYEAYVLCVKLNKRISDFQGGLATLSMNFEVPEGKDPTGFSAWYVSEEGELQKLYTYFENGKICWNVRHFSDFVVAYDENDVACKAGEDCPSKKYTDLNTDLWYHEYTDYVIREGLMIGIGNDMFAPYGVTTRAMVITTLYRMEGSPEVTTVHGYSDVKDDFWYTDAIAWATSVGVVEGYGNGCFGPNDAITREQIATVFFRYAQYKGVDVSGRDDLSDCVDLDQISDWALDAMKWAVYSGMMNGVSTTELRMDPLAESVRVELAALLDRWNEYFVQ